MSKMIQKRLPTWTSVRLGLAMVAACGGGLGVAACTQDAGHSGNERAPEDSASAGTQILRTEVSAGEADGPAVERDGGPADLCGEVDWSQAQLQITSSGSSPDSAKLASLSAQLLDKALCVRVTGNGVVGSDYNLLIETDGTLRTGLQSLDSWAIAGAEYWVSAGILMKATTPLTSGGVQVGPVVVVASSGSLVFELPRELLKATVADTKLGLGFQLLENWAARASLSLPAGPALIQLDGRWVGDELDTSACPTPSTAVGGLEPVVHPQPGRSAIPLSKGVIAPLYLPVPAATASAEDPDKNRWSLVSTAAATARTPAGAPIDFWVVLNGSNNGPPSTKTEWENARAVWEPVGASQSGGRLFGYVHTVQSHRDAAGNTFVGPEFRSLAEVENEITAWVTNVDGLDGIWLDEFIPRFEIAGSAVLPGLAVTSPNESLRPIDPNVQAYPQSFGALQVDPTCGYYDRLTRWIHASYPWLRIIGNPGSPLQNNQRSYARLVDVLVGYEHSLLEASAANWTALAKGYEPLARGNLALVHGGTPLDAPTATRRQAIDEAFKAGFTHVYVTDHLYSTAKPGSNPDSLGNQNVWGDLPRVGLDGPTNTGSAMTKPPLAEELDYVAGKL
ncbi:MAG: hypothetical protein JWN04_965 [Myxococcaceae bacterium]|nr:hypothetical protein [Myxococcaceae bacterium]